MTQAEKIVQFAESKVGMGYIWGSRGAVLTPQLLAQYKKNSPDHVDTSIVSKWMGLETYDCASFIAAAMNAGGVKMSASGVSTQWKKTKWADKGTIDTLPKDRVCCLYREDPQANPMQHGGVYLGNGYEIDASGSKTGVIKRKVNAYKWTHWGVPKGLENQESNDEVIKVLYTGTVYAANGRDVRMRAGMSTNANVIKSLPVGTPVNVLEEYNGWYKIGVDGSVGYMMSDFIKKEEQSSPIEYYYVKIPCSSKEQAEALAAAFKKAVVD